MRTYRLLWLIFLVIPAFSQMPQKQYLSDEELETLTDEQLVRCFRDYCSANSPWDIANELESRHHETKLVRLYQQSPSMEERHGIELALYRSRQRSVVAPLMQKIMHGRTDDGENRYFPLMYLAKACDRNALHELSIKGHKAFSVSSLQWGETLEVFGQCRYRVAIPEVVTGLYFASLNTVESAKTALDLYYPDAKRKKFRSLDSMQAYYCKRILTEGYKSDCNK